MKLERNSYQDYHNCPVAKTLKVIGNKYAMLILHQLFDGHKRFGQLQRLLPGISPKTLSIRLKELEKEKIILKKIYPQVPLKVEYSLTQRGQSLETVFDQLARWGVSN